MCAHVRMCISGNKHKMNALSYVNPIKLDFLPNFTGDKETHSLGIP